MSGMATAPAVGQPPPSPPPQAPPPPAPPSLASAPSLSALGHAEGADPYIGRTIGGKFQIIDLLGQGGMGKVYKAKHTGLDKIVCVKTLKPALLEDATVVGRFEREAKSASRLNHANSIQVLDFGQDEFGALYIAMEFVSGKDLRRTLRDEFPLGEERICHIMAQVLSALAEAHAQNVIHRDLKPENIMLEQRRGEPDFVKVLDFGIAKIQDADVPGLTRADVVCGTPLYMSPEQATGAKFDARADLYAIGVILYQLTTGTLPFDGANSMEILTRHVTELPMPPRTRRPEVAISPEMEALILRALEKEPEKRPQNAEEFRAEVLKIRDVLRRRREDAEESAKKASTQHKEQRAQAMRDKQAAQQASFSNASNTSAEIAQAMPKSKTPLYAGIGVGALVLIGGAFVALRPSPAPEQKPAVTDTTKPVADTTRPVADTTRPVADTTKPVADTTPAVADTTPPVTDTTKPVADTTKPVADTSRPVAVAPSPAPNVPPTPKEPAQPPPEKGDTAKAASITEEADLLFEEGGYADAIALYKKAVAADPSYAKGWKGLIRAGTAGADAGARKAGLTGYLRAAPTAPDADGYRKMLQSLK